MQKEITVKSMHNMSTARGRGQVRIELAVFDEMCGVCSVSSVFGCHCAIDMRCNLLQITP